MKKKFALLVTIAIMISTILCGCGDVTISGEADNNKNDEITEENFIPEE